MESIRTKVRYCTFPGQTLEEVVSKIMDFARVLNSADEKFNHSFTNGFIVFADFNGKELNTEMTEDECYQTVTGDTREEHEKKAALWLAESERRNEEYEKRKEWLIENFCERAKDVIPEDRIDDLKALASVRFSDIYHGYDMECMLDLIRLRKSGATIDECLKAFDGQGHSGHSAGLTCSLISHFLDPEFANALYNGKSDEEKQEK